MSSCLKDLDVSTDIFYEALVKGRNSRDINRMVYEKLLAMEDFMHFKKIMVKRNIELQLEAMRGYQNMVNRPGDLDRLDNTALADEGIKVFQPV